MKILILIALLMGCSKECEVWTYGMAYHGQSKTSDDVWVQGNKICLKYVGEDREIISENGK